MSERAARPRGALTALYLALAGLAALAVAALFAGAGGPAPVPVAGGYEPSGRDACLGGGFQLAQSGRFVRLDGLRDGVEGRLELAGERLAGDVTCASGAAARLDARVEDRRLAGELSGRAFEAVLEREAAAPGERRAHVPGSIAGEYELAPRSRCLGGELRIDAEPPGLALMAGAEPVGRARYERGRIRGAVRCIDGGTSVLTGEAAGRRIELTLNGAGGERLVGERRREAASQIAAFLLAVALVMVLAKLFGAAVARLGQPRVMGEVISGMLLGPTALGALAPGVQAALLPEDIVPTLGVVAQLGLVFYMFLVGLDLDLAQLSGRVRQVAAVSNASVTFPMVLGIGVAVPIYGLVGTQVGFVPFALFMGVAMSVSAFPVLARIVSERRLLGRPVGAVAIACAAVDDVTAWCLVALASAATLAGSAGGVVRTIALAALFGLVMWFAVRPLLARAGSAYDEAGRVPPSWITLIFAGVLVSAYLTEEIGIALIFGAFVMGLAMPRHAGLTEDVTRRLEDFVVLLLLPLFFAYTGLRLDVGVLDRWELWAIAGVLLAAAVVGKLAGATIAARLTGFDWRSSTVIGTLLNTRGLTELIVLNLALDLGAISPALFAMLVLMALITTFMTGPALQLLDPRNELGASLREPLAAAREQSRTEFPQVAAPEQSIVVAAGTPAALAQLSALAEPLARSEPVRELILVRIVQPPTGTAVRAGLRTENELLAEASAGTSARRRELQARGVPCRSVAFVSPDPGADVTRIATDEGSALVLLDGRRPLLGEGVPRGTVGAVLEHAPCDVVALVAKEGAPVRPREGARIVVPFGGADHDWAAVELGAWIASSTGARLELLGAADGPDGRQRASQRLADAVMLLELSAGVAARPVVAQSGSAGVLETAEGARLLVVGLSDRWRDEGLGATRSTIARAAPAPILFVRRGRRPGALAPPSDVTRFGWSRAAAGKERGRDAAAGPE